MKLIYIQWLDATSPSGSSWWTEEEAIKWADKDNYWVEEIGWVLKETKDYILFTSKKSMTTSPETDSLVQYGNLLRIPKPWIRKRKEIKL